MLLQAACQAHVGRAEPARQHGEAGGEVSRPPRTKRYSEDTRQPSLIARSDYHS
jgi:hypothetical protein